MNKFIVRTLHMSRRGRRTTSADRICSLLGTDARSKSHFEAAKRVLEGHLVFIDSEQRTDGQQQQQGRRQQEEWEADSAGTSDFGHGSIFEDTEDFSEGHRGRTRANLKASGFVSSFADGALCTLARIYLKCMQAKGAYTRQHILSNANMVHRILTFTMERDRSLNDRRAAVSPTAASAFLTGARGILRPNSIKNHAAAMVSFLEQAQTDVHLQPQFGPGDKGRLRAAAEQWRDTKRKADRQCRALQRVDMMSGELPAVSISAVCRYLQHLVDFQITAMLQNLQTLPQGCREVPVPQRRDWNTMLCYVAILFMLNGQRLCAALGLTLDEVDAARVHGSRAVLRVGRHKTCRTSGAAGVVLKSHQLDFLRHFVAARRRLDTPARQVLVGVSGRPGPSRILHPFHIFVSSQILPDVSNLGEWADHAGAGRPTHKLVRKVIETSTYLVSDQDALGARERTAMHLCHGEKAIALHYRYKTDDAVLDAGRTVESILSQLAALELVQGGARDGGLLPASPFGECLLPHRALLCGS